MKTVTIVSSAKYNKINLRTDILFDNNIPMYLQFKYQIEFTHKIQQVYINNLAWNNFLKIYLICVYFIFI